MSEVVCCDSYSNVKKMDIDCVIIVLETERTLIIHHFVQFKKKKEIRLFHHGAP